MTGKFTTLAICLGCVVVFSDQVHAADHGVMKSTSEVKTAFFQPRPGGVLDVLTSPFRPASYNKAYQTGYRQSTFGRTNCVNGKCYTGKSYQAPCVGGNCAVGSGYRGNYNTGNCLGGNCGISRYQSPYQNNSMYRGNYGYGTQQHSTYRPVSQPVYRPVSQPVYQPYRSVPTGSNRNDPFFP